MLLGYIINYCFISFYLVFAIIVSLIFVMSFSQLVSGVEFIKIMYGCSALFFQFCSHFLGESQWMYGNIWWIGWIRSCNYCPSYKKSYWTMFRSKANFLFFFPFVNINVILKIFLIFFCIYYSWLQQKDMMKN